jgi:hypothetical protein
MIKQVSEFSISFVLLIVLLASCNDTKVENTIPEKDFISILTDSYLADGLLTVPSIREMYSKRDSVSNYMDIVKTHGFTWEQMQNTLEIYFIGDPKKLSKIYDQILVRLSEMESQASVAQQIKLNADAEKQKTKYHFVMPDSAITDKPDFSYNFIGPGTFRLMFSVTIYPTDSSLDPCFEGSFSAKDGKAAGKIVHLGRINYIKDGKPHEYLVTGKVETEGSVLLKGYYFNFRNNPVWTDHFADIHNLNFNYIGAPVL